MQTFLPYKDFERSARCLDKIRLGNQRRELVTILRALAGETRGYANHPVTLMWKGYEAALIDYATAVAKEWNRRGGGDVTFNATLVKFARQFRSEAVEMPWWLGDKKFHRAHRSNLVRKDPKHYREYFPKVPDNLSYIWPTKHLQ